MKKNSTFLLAVLLTAILSFVNAFAQENGRNALLLLDSQIDNLIPVEKLAPQTPTRSEAIKRARSVFNDGVVMRIYADYKYNRYGILVQKSKYSYDEYGRNTETIKYILNDGSQSWMYGREKWIVSSLSKRYNSKWVRYYLGTESYILDMSTGILKGQSFSKGFDSQIEGFSGGNESYTWDDTLNEWKGTTKYVNTNTLNSAGTEINRERIYYTWDAVTKQWQLDNSKKYTYKYILIDTYWFIAETKTYTLTNGNYVCTSETVSIPNYELKQTQNSITKSTVNGVLVNTYQYIYSFNSNKKRSQNETQKWNNNQWENYERTIYSYNTYGRNKLTETYRWHENQWKLTRQTNYDYSLPDSVQTQTDYKTAASYLVINQAVPSLCSGQTLFPQIKYVSKYHPITNATEVYYYYSWNTSNCSWTPSGNKSVITYDQTGLFTLSETLCDSTTLTDWIGCQTTNYTHNYNSKGYATSSIASTGGNTSSFKEEYVYNQSDTVLLKTKYYITIDINGDGIIGSNEWANDGELVNNYNPPFTTDSAHVTTSTYGDLEMYDLSNLKKLKVTGPVSCDELSAINELSRDSLEVLDLSDATLKGDSLTEECMGDTELQTLILPKSLKVIDEEAIESDPYDSKYLKTLIVYPSIQVIHPYGILIGRLENVTIPSKYFKNLFEMGDETNIQGIKDVYKTSLKSATFNDLNGKISDAICYNMPYLQKVTIEDGITEIGNNAFKSCGMLREVNFPASSLRKIGYNAFWGCNELTSLTLPEGLNTIDYSAFWGCSGVNSITMPSSLTNIAQNAFWGCSAVSSMKVGAQTPPVLGINALQGVPREANVIVPETGLYAYKAAPQWKEFFNMNTDIQNTQHNAVILTSTNGQLSLQNLPENSTISVYNTIGSKLITFTATAKNESIQLAKGAYIIQIGNQHFKTLVK